MIDVTPEQQAENETRARLMRFRFDFRIEADLAAYRAAVAALAQPPADARCATCGLDEAHHRGRVQDDSRAWMRGDLGSGGLAQHPFEPEPPAEQEERA